MNDPQVRDYNEDEPCRRCTRCGDCHFCNDCYPCTGDMDPAYQAEVRALREKEVRALLLAEDPHFRARQEEEAWWG